MLKRTITPNACGAHIDTMKMCNSFCRIYLYEMFSRSHSRSQVPEHTHIHSHIVSASSFRRRNSGLAYQMNSYMYAFRTMPLMYYTLCDLQHYTSALLTICILACYFSYGNIYTNANFTSFHRFLFTTHFNGKQPPNKISKGILMVCSNHS